MLNSREKDYVDSICLRVRWKQAHECIRKELGDHIEDQREAFIAEGMTPEDASEAAIREMGDSDLVGGSMDKVYRPRVSAKFLLIFVGIFLLGCVFRIITEQIEPAEILSILFSAALFCCIVKWGELSLLMRLSWWIIRAYLFIGIVAPVVIPYLPNHIPYYLQWELLSYLSLFQPIVFTLALWKMKNKGIFGVLGAFVFCIISMLTTTLNISLMMGMLLLDMCLLAYATLNKWFGEKRKALTVVVIAGVIAVAAAVLMFILYPRILSGYDVYFGGWQNYYLYSERIEILEKCKLFGNIDIAGLSEEAQVFLADNYYVKNNYMLVVLASRLGLWVYAVIAALFITLSVIGCKMCLKEKNMVFRLIAFSVLGAFAIQYVEYYAINLGLTFSVLPLPFISNGNASLIVNMALMGILFCILGKGWIYTEERAKEEPRRPQMS